LISRLHHDHALVIYGLPQHDRNRAIVFLKARTPSFFYLFLLGIPIVGYSVRMDSLCPYLLPKLPNNHLNCFLSPPQYADERNPGGPHDFGSDKVDADSGTDGLGDDDSNDQVLSPPPTRPGSTQQCLSIAVPVDPPCLMTGPLHSLNISSSPNSHSNMMVVYSAAGMTTNPGSRMRLASSSQKSGMTWLDFFNVISPQPDMDSVSRALFSMERTIRDSIRIMQKPHTSFRLNL
jgi:hypothetical protein